MNKPPWVPPVKCQGIKTKLVNEIKRLANGFPRRRWVEPFCGSCVVALNLQPKSGLLADSNVHIIRLYKDIQAHLLTPVIVREFLQDQGNQLRRLGEDYYYEVRDRFNSAPNSLDFLFLNRSCFNGVMRFNRSGKFNVPFCRKPERFSQAYITKIANQVFSIARVVSVSDWEFRVADFRDVLAEVTDDDFVYADPPYAGRHVDYFNTWSEADEGDLAQRLAQLPGRFILSTWHSNKFRVNPLIEKNWSAERFHIFTRQHYYHVGATEDLRHAMVEALITNFAAPPIGSKVEASQQLLFVEEPKQHYSLVNG
ncbi:MAG: Dam family site-specific DNA-(adenine-N6)-methyltransferase [Pseudomonadota bacterium]|nr:Dam family site-specific DNA-(adenine-N6)-methyltransferase [Pseudomonadota bacterium]